MKFLIAILAIINSTVFAIPVADRSQLGDLDRRGNFPAGKEAAYITQCTQVAADQGLDAATAKKHCECGAQAIKKNFTDAEIEELDSSDDGVDVKLMQKTLLVIARACKL